MRTPRRPTPRPATRARRLQSGGAPLTVETLEARTVFDAGDLDPTFGDGGIVSLSGYKWNDQVLQADGKVVAVGTTLNAASQDFVVARFHLDGTLDQSFGQGGILILDVADGSTDAATAVAIDSFGRIVVAGIVGDDYSDWDFAAMRLHADGSIDESFGDGGAIVVGVGGDHDYLNAVTIASDGRILLAGRSELTVTSSKDFSVVRLTAAGALDVTFSGDGKATYDFGGGEDEAFAIVVQADGKVVLAGAADSSDYGVVRFNADGSLDASFDGDGAFVYGPTNILREAYVAAVDSHGRLLIGGQSPNSELLRLNADGSLDAGFGTGGVVKLSSYSDPIRELNVAADGKIVVVGERSAGVFIARLNADGTLDGTFSGDGKIELQNSSAKDLPLAVQVASNGLISVAGTARSSVYHPTVNNTFDVPTSVFFSLRLTAAGGLDSTFSGDGQSVVVVGQSGLVPIGSAVQSDGKILVAGSTAGRAVVRRYLSDGSLDGSFGINGQATLPLYAATGFAVGPDGKIVLADAQPSGVRLARLTADGELDETFGEAGVVFVSRSGSDYFSSAAVAVAASGKIVVTGSFLVSPSLPYNTNAYVLQFNVDGSRDAGFGVNGLTTAELGGFDQVRAVAVDALGRVVVTGRSRPLDGSIGDVVLARFALDGSLDATFNETGVLAVTGAGFLDSAYSIAIDSAGRIVVAGAGTPLTGPSLRDDMIVIRVTESGELDAGFGAGGRVYVAAAPFASDAAYALTLAPNGKIVVAGQSSNSLALVRLNADGSLDSTFEGDGRLVLDRPGAILKALTLGIDGEGRIVVAGDAAIGGFLVRLQAAPDLALSNATVPETSPAGVSVGSLSPVDGGVYTYTLLDDAEGRFVLVDGVLSTAQAITDPRGSTFTLRVGIYDAGGLVGVQSLVVTVSNLAPTAPSDSDAAPNVVAHGAAGGTSVGLTAASSDPGGAAIAYSLVEDAGGRFAIDAQTGVVTVNAAGPGVNYASSGGVYTIVVAASDGATATTAEFTIEVSAPTHAVFVAEDPVHGGVQSLFVYATSGNDAIDVAPGKKGTPPGTVVVTMNKVKTTLVLPPGGWINVFAGAGHDKADVYYKLTYSAYLEGGEGNDRLEGARGDDVIVGGAGDDSLNGQGGRDLVIGGLGRDKVYGVGTGSSSAREGNLLIGDATDFESDRVALAALSAAWSANAPGTVSAAVRTYLNDESIREDGQADSLKGTTKGVDWFWSFELTSQGKRLDKLSSLSKNDLLN